MVLIQIVAALLLLAGSGLIFRALVALDAPTQPRIVRRSSLQRLSRADVADDDLRRAA